MVAAAVPGPSGSGLVGADRDDRPGCPRDGRLLAGAVDGRAGAGLAVAAVVSLAVLLARVVLPMRWWTRPRTAAEIEGRFPQLGQRIRTVVQYAVLDAEQIDSEGATPSLVDALEDETEARAEPLPLDRIVPWWRARAVAVLAAIPVIVLLVAAAFGPEWRIALTRRLS